MPSVIGSHKQLQIMQAKVNNKKDNEQDKTI